MPGSWRSNWCPWLAPPKDAQKHEAQPAICAPKASHPKIPKRRKRPDSQTKPRTLSSLFRGDKMEKYASMGYTGGWAPDGKQKWVTELPSNRCQSVDQFTPSRGLRAPARGLPEAKPNLPWNMALSDPQSLATRVAERNMMQQHESVNIRQSKSPTLFSPPGAWERRLQEATPGGGSAVNKPGDSSRLMLSSGVSLSRTAGVAPPNRTGGRRDGTGFSHSLLGASANGQLGARATIVSPGVAERMFDGYRGKYIGLNDRNPVGTLIHTTKSGNAVPDGAVPKQRNSVTGTRTLAGCSNSVMRSSNARAMHIVQPAKSIPRPHDPHCILGPNDSMGALQCLGMFPDFKFLVRTFNEQEPEHQEEAVHERFERNEVAASSPAKAGSPAADFAVEHQAELLSTVPAVPTSPSLVRTERNHSVSAW